MNALDSSSPAPDANSGIPDSLPPLSGTDKTITINGAEFTLALRLLMDYQLLLKKSITKIRTQMDEHMKEHDTLRMPPPELDGFCTDHTLTTNLIREWIQKSPF